MPTEKEKRLELKYDTIRCFHVNKRAAREAGREMMIIERPLIFICNVVEVDTSLHF